MKTLINIIWLHVRIQTADKTWTDAMNQVHSQVLRHVHCDVRDQIFYHVLYQVRDQINENV